MLKLVVTKDGMTLSGTGVSGSPDLNDWIEEKDGTYTVTIRNVIGYELPHTGGIGPGIFKTAGLALMLGAALILSKRIRG